MAAPDPLTQKPLTQHPVVQHPVGQPPLRRTAGRRIRLALAAAAGLASAWLFGLGWFFYVASRDAPPFRHADAIVALTGGPERVEVALRLLASGAADRLLVSGAGEKTDLAVLAYLAGLDPAPLEQQTTLGHAAHSTRGNALETATWAQDEGVGSLLVVTAWFHMPRALMELRRAMPSVTLRPYPVGHMTAADLTHTGSARRVINEYHKYLAALAGLSDSPLAIAAWRMDPAG
jgi:uncharacterized SAM-binding protein YcdF (DUF218 family)